jgi:hypothetical protein
MRSLVANPRTWGPLAAVALALASRAAIGALPVDPPAAYQLRLDSGHPWRPPFRLDRVGQPITAVVESSAQPGPAVYTIQAFSNGNLVGSQTLSFTKIPPYSARLTIERVTAADELVLSAKTEGTSKPTALARQGIALPEFEADAVATPDRLVNPVDLGTILVPAGWLLLGLGQTATLEVAAISRTRDLPNSRVQASFNSAPARMVASPIPLHAGVRTRLDVNLAEAPPTGDRDVLTVTLDDGAGRELWRKTIPVMLVRDPPRRPRFGATYESLRYDAPISVREPGTGKFSSMRYEDGWKSDVRDVVVWLPNGGRFVFWRGSSFIPFWAGIHNTAACYEWAEIISQPRGAVDCVEPLMDKELRYGRVEIVESTPARVHVRWRYQSTDFEYKVWGDEAVEDYYFYPDGFGTRVVNLKADPKNDYELSEFIMITPQGAYPFEVLPDDPIDALYLDGRRHAFRFPNPTAADPALQRHDKTDVPALYRLRFGKNEALSAIYFNPGEAQLPGVVFAPFFDAGQMVTPSYWGSHWPLARGNSTGRTIDDRIQFTPTHNSVMSWAGKRPVPLATAEHVTLDTLGRSRRMTTRRWAWLIGMSDADDARLVDWAKSFATPPSVELRGARVDLAGYAPERRAICLEVLSRDVQIRIKPSVRCVNPVFEFKPNPGVIDRLTLAGRPLERDRFAWDGRTLWLNLTIEAPTEIRMEFRKEQERGR